MSELPSVSLPQYEGPLDLLLDLVRQRRLNILDLPIAEVTRQYLDYIHEAQELNIDLSAEFIFMEATLILIKSRSLLPRRAAEPDPRDELAEQLMSHDQAKQAGDLLAERLEETAKTWSNPGSAEDLETADADNLSESADPMDRVASAKNGNMNLLDALRLMQKALAVTTARRSLVPRRDAVSLEDMVGWLASQLQQLTGRCSLTLEEAFRAQSTPEHRAMLFLALLEMARGRRLHLDQEECFGAVRISTTNGATR